MVRTVWTHPSNRGRRARQMLWASSVQFRKHALHRRAAIPIGRHGGRIWLEPDHPGGIFVAYANPPDWPYMLVWERWLRGTDLFLDVGAYIGYYSVFATSLGAEVVAIEPAPETLVFLHRNNELNGNKIQILEAAIGATVGEAHMTRGGQMSNHLDPNGEQSVPVVTLDDVIGSRTVDGLKLDVEGHELPALLGAARALNEHRIRLLQIEWNSLADRAPVTELLRTCGYEFFQPTAEGRLVPFHPGSTGPDIFASAQGVLDHSPLLGRI
jgi:FkbM family methyltransferase